RFFKSSRRGLVIIQDTRPSQLLAAIDGIKQARHPDDDPALIRRFAGTSDNSELRVESCKCLGPLFHFERGDTTIDLEAPDTSHVIACLRNQGVIGPPMH